MRPPDGPSPVHRVVVYYQTQYQDNKYISPSPLISVASHLIIAAFHLNDDKTIHINNDPPDDASFIPMWRDVARMQGSGIKVMAMLGGACQGSYKNLSKDFDTYYGLLSSCITEYRLDGIDLDIEESESLDDLVKLIQNLRADFGTDFIITLAPVASALQGGTDSFSGFKYSDLESGYGDQIDWYNVQFYSGFGTMSTTTDYTDIVQKCPLDPSRIVAGTLTNSDNGSGFVQLDDVKTTARKLLQQYGHRFGGLAGWEYHNSMPDSKERWTWAALMKVTMNNWKEVLAAGVDDSESSSGESSSGESSSDEEPSQSSSDEDEDELQASARNPASVA
ncbi:glycoside hydrolase family 18 protein [Collybiopsis luxurians FD-317 M1]|uniref:chitinase n=1 Tax=Collybiopsis luxurians FD-317 M1 TaxID=944289 RepID=A0A0D0ARE4_9AGAR|nr:glycoside hydrolase family 18 protein [Collybiopsis luxurians FD-317 M1]